MEVNINLPSKCAMVFSLFSLRFGDHLRRCTALPKHWAENDKNRNNNNHLFSSAQIYNIQQKIIFCVYPKFSFKNESFHFSA